MVVKRFLLLALVFSVMVTTAPALADDDFYVVAGGGAVGTKITSLPAAGLTISTPGFYFLGCNLTFSGPGSHAINITADDVTLDLMGFSLIGPGGGVGYNGINFTGRTNVEIRNGTVRGFAGAAVQDADPFKNGNKHRISNVRVTNNFNGVLLYGNNHLIKNCSASNNTAYGLYMDSGLICDSVANNNNNGVYLGGPGSVLGNTACNNSAHNFWLGVASEPNPTSILVDRNSAFGLINNYYKAAIGGVVITANNSPMP